MSWRVGQGDREEHWRDQSGFEPQGAPCEGHTENDVASLEVQLLRKQDCLPIVVVEGWKGVKG